MSEFFKRISNKIKSFLNRIFNKKQLMIESKNSLEDEKRNKTQEIERQNEKTIKEIIDMTESNPELLNNLSIKKLKVIDKYYDDSLEKINNVIIEFRKSLRNNRNT